MLGTVARRSPRSRSGVARVRAWRAGDARITRLDVRVVAAVATFQRRDPAPQPFPDDLPADVGDAVDREPEVLEDRAGRRRGTEMVQPDDRALVTDPALPAERHTNLDAHPLLDSRRQHLVPVRL